MEERKNETMTNGSKLKKSSFDTRVRTALLEELHLTKSIASVSSVEKRYKRNGGYKEETVYFFKAAVSNTDSIYSGIEAYSNSEQDALNKLNDALYGLAVVADEVLFKKVIAMISEKDKKRKESEERKAGKKNNEARENEETAA